MPKKYVVDLTEEERDELKEIVSTGEHSARKIRWAHVLLERGVEVASGDQVIIHGVPGLVAKHEVVRSSGRLRPAV